MHEHAFVFKFAILWDTCTVLEIGHVQLNWSSSVQLDPIGLAQLVVLTELSWKLGMSSWKTNWYIKVNLRHLRTPLKT